MGGINEKRCYLDWIMETLDGLRGSCVEQRLEKGTTHGKD